MKRQPSKPRHDLSQTGVGQQHIADDFARDGFVFPLGAFGLDEAEGFRRKLERIETDYGGILDLAMLFRGYPHLVMPFVAAIVRHPAITGPVTEILGPDVLVWNTSFFIKEPNTRNYVSWHQDLHYWGLDRDDEVTAWLALSPATRQNGCMRFVAGSHHQNVAHHDTHDADNLLSRGQEIAVPVNDSEAVDVILQPGEMSLHHGRTFHASHANRSDDRRIGLAIRYVGPATRQVLPISDFAMLACGQDKHGHFELLDAPKTLMDPQDLATIERIHAEQGSIFMGVSRPV